MRGETVEPSDLIVETPGDKPRDIAPKLPLEAAAPDDLPPADELAAWPEPTLVTNMRAAQPAVK
jgi:hypothetical protein